MVYALLYLLVSIITTVILGMTLAIRKYSEESPKAKSKILSDIRNDRYAYAFTELFGRGTSSIDLIVLLTCNFFCWFVVFPIGMIYNLVLIAVEVFVSNGKFKISSEDLWTSIILFSLKIFIKKDDLDKTEVKDEAI